MARKNTNTTLETELYQKLQMIALKLSYQNTKKVNVNDLIEEGMRMIVEKYGDPLDNQTTKK